MDLARGAFASGTAQSPPGRRDPVSRVHRGRRRPRTRRCCSERDLPVRNRDPVVAGSVPVRTGRRATCAGEASSSVRCCKGTDEIPSSAPHPPPGGGSADRSSAERRSPPRTVRVGPPFLERCAAQLPCLRDGLDPRDGSRYPNLARWYTGRWTRRSRRNACRVSGNPSSWRMVLTMAGYGNAGNVPPSILGRMRDLGWRGGVDRGRRRR